MDRGGLPPAQGRNHRRGQQQARQRAGIKITERDGAWHVSGRIRLVGMDGRVHSVRLRRSTNLPATPENLPHAEAIKDRWSIEVRNQILYGVKPSAPVPIAAKQFLARTRKNGRPAGQREIDLIQKIVKHFGMKLLNELADEDWTTFVDRLTKGNAASTRERVLNIVLSFLNWCKKPPREWIATLPSFERDQAARKPRHRVRRRVAEWTPELVALFIDAAGWHLKPQLWVEWSTGARVSSVLHDCRLCDVILAEGREQITFGMTKNGDPVTAALHPDAAEAIRVYLKRRGRLHDREGPLFLRKDGQPYEDNGFSGQNRTAFNNTKRRAVRELRRTALADALALRRAGRRDEAREVAGAAWANIKLVRLLTQHWFRHLLATTLVATGNLRAAMDQGGWRDVHSVMAYAHDVPAVRRQIISQMPTAPARRTDKA